MFGKNSVAGKMHDAKGRLLVNDLFYTFQGEGPDAGRAAVFLRLAKCNLRCYFCDTEFEQGSLLTARDIVSRIVAMRRAADLVVITGGEPMLQNIVPLVKLINAEMMSVAVETAGTIAPDGLSEVFKHNRAIAGNIIVVSPKTPKISPTIAMLAGAYKYIVRVGECDPLDGLPIASTQIQGEDARIARPQKLHAPQVPVYVQAMDEQDTNKTQRNLEYAASLVMNFGYRLSVQTHKLAGVP